MLFWSKIKSPISWRTLCVCGNSSSVSIKEREGDEISIEIKSCDNESEKSTMKELNTNEFQLP